METVHLLIKGKVQGVFFRATAKKNAEKYKIKGWIRNTKDKNVEAMITGEPGMLEQFIEWCKKGPDEAKVEEVAILKQPEKEFRNFEIIR